MKCRGFKDVIDAISQQYSTTLTVKIQPYKRKRKIFKVPYHSIERYLDWEMELMYNNRKVTFRTITGEKHSIWNTAIKMASVDLLEVQDFMDAGTIECRNFKQVVHEVNKHNNVLLTISLWTYSSGRMTFTTSFDSIKHCLDNDMVLIGDNNDKLTFIDNEGGEHNFPCDKLKIAKLDYLDIPNFVQSVNSI